MRPTLGEHQVFLNYPFSDAFEPFANAMHFGIVAAGLIPVCARDLTSPDRPRLEILVKAITDCHYSIHDFSKLKGEGDKNLARLNMTLEMGMALFHALQTQRTFHRCAFFVSTAHEYQVAASDLAGLDPLIYQDDEISLAAGVYEWLRDVAQNPITKRISTPEVKNTYLGFKAKTLEIEGSGTDGRASHHEAQELMFQICAEHKLWDWRENSAGKLIFPLFPLSWKK